MTQRTCHAILSISRLAKRLPPLSAILAATFGAELLAEEVPARVVTVVAEKVDSMEREFTLTGTVTPRRDARLSARTDGLVAAVAVDAGSLVKPGDVLATLDTRLAEIALDLIRAEIAQAEVELAEAVRREEEVREISKTGAFPKSEAETRKSTVNLREAALARLRVREAAELERIERHRLVAPFGGIIVEKLAEAGEWVETGTPVLRLVETDAPRFDLRVPQEFLARVSSASGIRVVLDSFPAQALDAQIDAVVPVKDEASRTFLTRLGLSDPGHLAAPGMSGRAVIGYRSDHGDSVRIPRDAIVRYPDGTVKVWIVTATGEGAKVDSRVVRTTTALGESAEVLEGLSGGETIVLKGNEGLREGQAVAVAGEGGKLAPP